MIKNLLPYFLLFAVVLLYSSCKKGVAKPQNTGITTLVSPTYSINMPDSADQNALVDASLKIGDAATGQVVPADFLGFSFEKEVVTDTAYFNASNTTFINMFRNLGDGLIRIGGATVDETFWSNATRQTGVTDSVYTNDVSRFKAFAQSVGWKTIWGLNLGTGSPANVADEAQYVSQNMGSEVASFATGNEPEYYAGGLRPPNYSSSEYLNEFENFSNAVKTAVPNAVFSGPENQFYTWELLFLQGVSSRMNMLTIHYYPLGPAGSQFVTMDNLLTFNPVLQVILSNAAAQASQMKLPFRVTECNSVTGGGQPGISNAYASSLWGSEVLFYLAQQGAAGINFHTGGTPNYVYSPISTVNGKSVARPLYYAMLLFHQANIGQFTNNQLSNPSAVNMDAYSFTTRDNKKGILIINKDPSNDLSMTISTDHFIQTATVYQLIGPGLSRLTGTNINGSMVNDDGTFSVNGQEFILSKKYASVLAKVKPASAMLIILD
jgi:hypothetical protein